ncbi:MAG: hypothetical protein IAI50_15470 [Candidatus Eremiobacteraeota bacterium]|nr:hypothetical protein [Candidatus Eremiobacteraeota bacterium]
MDSKATFGIIMAAVGMVVVWFVVTGQVQRDESTGAIVLFKGNGAGSSSSSGSSSGAGQADMKNSSFGSYDSTSTTAAAPSSSTSAGTALASTGLNAVATPALGLSFS